MQDITKIKTKYWQHKRGSFGDVVTGINDIKQAIDTVCMTQKGSVPFMPELGTDIISTIGLEPDETIENLTGVWQKEIPLQVPRCEVTDITGTKDDNGKVKMNIWFREKNTAVTGKTEIYIGG